MMKSKKQISDLVGLLKVFDVNYVSDDDVARISGLDINNDEDVRKAIDLLLIPAFNCYLASSREVMLNSLRISLSSEKEVFLDLFDQIEMAFERPLTDRRRFMSSVLNALESAK